MKTLNIQFSSKAAYCTLYSYFTLICEYWDEEFFKYNQVEFPLVIKSNLIISLTVIPDALLLTSTLTETAFDFNSE